MFCRSNDQIGELTIFLDARLFDRFVLPARLSAG
jgi:hypothetical protein